MMNIYTLFRWGCFLALYCAALGSFSVAHAVKWDVEFWQSFNWTTFEKGPCKAYVVGEIRMRDDISKIYYYRISQCLAYHALSWLAFEVHYSLIYDLPHGGTKFIFINRYEFEANLKHKFDNGVTLKLRNRYELLKRQSVQQLQHVLRERFSVVFPVKDCGALIACTIFDEIFYDFDNRKFTQNRFCPINLTFKLYKRLNLTAYVMERDFYSFNLQKWFRSIVLGSEFQF